MSNNPAVTQLQDVMLCARPIAENIFGGVTHFDLFDGVTDTQSGFGVRTGPGLAMVLGNVTSSDVDGWYLQLCTAVGYEAPASMDVINWVNSRNRNSLAGKYYVALTPDGSTCAVAWETHIWCRLADSSIYQEQSLVKIRNFTQNMDFLGHVASQESQEFQKLFGGRLLTDNQQDMIGLFTMTSA